MRREERVGGFRVPWSALIARVREIDPIVRTDLGMFIVLVGLWTLLAVLVTVGDVIKGR